ncbi:MAG TPA: ABC transporter permease [Gemmatimonadaceae bacterium]|nr:ABC transporter permease [Gemmatimonadaceae bacterium]
MRWILRDARFALRTLRRRRVFTGIAIATIAIGIGAATSIYSVVDSILVRPLAFADPGRLIGILQTYPKWKQNPIVAAGWDHIPLSIAEYRDLRDKQTSFTAVGIWTTSRTILGLGEKLEEVRTVRASSSLLSVIGVSPLLGRSFLPDEDMPTGAKSAMISYEAWQARFAGARDVVGRVVKLDDKSYTIVGVLPPDLRLGRTTLPANGDQSPPAFWIPVGHDSSDYYQRTNHSYMGLGRLKPGVTLARASADVANILKATPEDAQDKGTHLVEWQVDQTRDARTPLYVLMAAAALLLLIACVNVAMLMLGEAANREQEMAARAALGASRSRIVAQLLTESVLLSIGGLALGATFAWWGTRVLVAIAPAKIPGLTNVQLDGRVLAISIIAALITGALFGLAPAVTLSGTQPSMMLRAGGGQSARGRGAMQRALIAIELALSVVLLVGAGLLGRTLTRISNINPGFRTERLAVIQPSFPRTAMRDQNLIPAAYDQMLARVAALPGVTAVTAANAAPFSGSSTSSSFDIEGEVKDSYDLKGKFGGRHPAQQRVSIPGYFAAMEIPVLVGRDFDASDRMGSTLAAIISRTTARRDFPSESPIGKRVHFQGEWRTIVGVVDDVHLARLSKDFEATIYTPAAQRPGPWPLALFVRTSGDPFALIQTIRKIVLELSPPATTVTVDAMSTMVKRSFAEERYRALLTSLFGAIAAVLAGIGIYGVTSRSVTRRTREIAIRTALGATSTSITGQIVGTTLAGGAIGVVAGVSVALASARLLAPLLFGVSTTDPLTYSSIIVLLGLVSVAASWIPARRATRVSLAQTLRAE